MCYGDPSATEVPPCCETATKKLTFSTTSVLLLLNMPLSLSRATIFRRQKNPRRVYRPKIAGILFVCNEPEGKYYTVPARACEEFNCHGRLEFFVLPDRRYFLVYLASCENVNFYRTSTVFKLPWMVWDCFPRRRPLVCRRFDERYVSRCGKRSSFA